MGMGSEQVFWLLVVVVGSTAITLWALLEHLDRRVKARTKLRQTEAREETRREIAAYVAEGSISPDDAAKLMAAGAEGLEGVKAGLREVFAKGAEACGDAGARARAACIRVNLRGAGAQAKRDRCSETI